MKNILDFFHMHGYGFYVWSAYGLVIIFLLMQIIRPWMRWHRYVKKERLNHSIHHELENESHS